MNHNYFVYMLTNVRKTVLYIGVTNDLHTRLEQHREDSIIKKKTFAGKYNCLFLVWHERHQFIHHAIEREKEIKKWSRVKKEKLINEMNPEWRFLNDEI